MDSPRIISRELLQKGSRLEFYRDTLQIPNGNVVCWDYVKHNGAAAVLPVKPDGKIVMVRQYRNTFDCETLEIPAGALNSPDEDYEMAAARELEEETGYVNDKPLTRLFTIASAIAFCDEKIHIYLADSLTSGKQHPDEDEFINVEEYTLDELLNMISEGQITDSKSVAAIMAYKALIAQ